MGGCGCGGCQMWLVGGCQKWVAGGGWKMGGRLVTNKSLGVLGDKDTSNKVFVSNMF